MMRMSPARPQLAGVRTFWGVVAAVVLTIVLFPAVARADDAVRGSVALDPVGLFLHDGTASFLWATAPHESWRATEGVTSAPQLQWVGPTPRVSLVARDWNASQVLWGHLTVTDQMRLSRSSRMVVSRLRLAGGRLAPFAQIGVGQWRVDTSVVATLPTDVELAGQVGAGFELEVAPFAVIALQADCTFFFPEGREPALLASGHVWGTLLAARARF
jgi:hypothetical protein